MSSDSSSVDPEKGALPEQQRGSATDFEKETLEKHDSDIPSNDASSKVRESSEGNGDMQGDIEKGPGHKTEEADPNVVFWDGPDDPHNPMNFTTFRKGVTIGLVSAICFVTPLASSMFAPGVPFLMAEFKSTNVELASFVVSVYILGFAVGPLFFAPLSEIYGRLPVYHVCNLMFIVFTVACALSTNLNMLIGFRLLAGTFGSAPLVNGGGSIADLIIQEKRGGAMSLFAMGPIVGPVSESFPLLCVILG